MHRWLDRAILVLAGVSVLVFGLVVTGALSGELGPIVHAVDLFVVAAYAIIFALKGLLDEEPARWFRRHAWLALALMPLSIPILVAQPYFLAVQLTVLIVRVAKALDRALHLHVVAGLSQRYRARVAEEFTQPMLLNLASALEEALVARDYATVLGDRLHARRDLIEAAVRRGVDASPTLSKLSRFAPVSRMVDETTREIVDAAHATLASPETNELLHEAVRDAFRELKAGIAEPKWSHKGIGLGEAVHLVTHPRETHAPTPIPAGPPVVGQVAG